MKRKIIDPFLLGFCFLAFFIIGDSVHAQTDTPVNIQVVETPIRLEMVRAPTFGTYHVSSKSQKIKATGDLVIQVKDLRENKKTPWKLVYQLSRFSNGKEYDATIDLGKGTLSTVGDGRTLNADSKAVSLKANEEGTIVTAYSTNASEYLYRIDKQSIDLGIPENLPAGNYAAKQTVFLLNTPEVN